MKYIITSEKWAGELELEYDSSERLILFHIRAELTPEQHAWLLKMIPVHKADLPVLKTEYSRVNELPIDLSFENFWRVYNYKFGSKTRAEKLWNMLPMHEQFAAFAFIRVYDGQLCQTTIAKKYPETYLSKKDWIK